MMTTSQRAVSHSDSITLPVCPDCGMAMRLFGIEDEKPGYLLHSFECPACHEIGTDIVKIS
jgi:predicted RNA-binding Zn-ribbon protein involved in translation (DUF1610 family)